MNKIYKIGIIIIAFLSLVLVRYAEGVFYDPLREFFLGEFQHKPLPSIHYRTFILHTFIRYIVNSGLSVLILYLLFPHKKVLPLVLRIYTIAFLVLLPAYLWLVKTNADYFTLFYIRRLLIQPVLLLVLIPALYYAYRKV